ncbi:serine hydrolase [Myxococcaceae bacterium GXIMD 01537]
MSESAPTAPPTDAVLHATRRYLRAYPSASLCVGVTRRGVHHVQGLRRDGPPPADDSIHELGALTEVFTGSLLALLVDRGELKLDTPLRELIPLPLLPDERAGQVTVEQLATHTAGLPRDPPNLDAKPRNPADPYGHYTADLFGAFLRGFQPTRPPPHPHAPSLIGMGVLGHALSRRTRLNYGHALRDLLFKPLGMEDTTIRLSETQEPRLRPGHTAQGQPVPPWTFPSLPGAGALRSTVADLLRFLDVNLGHGDPSLVRAMKLAQAPRVKARGGSFGLGWNISRVGGEEVIWCSSLMGGTCGFLAFSARANTGVVLLSDRATSFFDSLLGRVPLEKPGFALLRECLP